MPTQRQLGPLDPIWDVETVYGGISVGNTPPSDIFPSGGNDTFDEFCIEDDVTYRYHIFTADGTLVWNGPARSCQIFMIGGGAGPGGGRAFINGEAGGSGGEQFAGTATVADDLTITIGAGGTFVNTLNNGTPGTAGGTTSITGGITASVAGGEGGGTDGAIQGGDCPGGGLGSAGSFGSFTAGAGGGAEDSPTGDASGTGGGQGVDWPGTCLTPTQLPNNGKFGGGGRGCQSDASYADGGVGRTYGGADNSNDAIANTGGGGCHTRPGATGVVILRYVVSTPEGSIPPLPDLLGWYDASDLGTIAESGGLVTQWLDKSGNGWHLAPVTGGSFNPDGPETGTRTLNGLNVLDFQNTAGEEPVQQLASALGMFGVADDYTILVVNVQDVTAASNAPFIAAFGESSAGHGLIFSGANTTRRVFITSGGDRTTDGGAVANGTWVLSTAEIGRQDTNDVLRYREDGAAVSSSGDGVAGTPTANLSLGVGGRASGNSRGLDGAVAEILVYKPFLDDGARDAAEAYLLNKWGV